MRRCIGILSFYGAGMLFCDALAVFTEAVQPFFLGRLGCEASLSEIGLPMDEVRPLSRSCRVLFRPGFRRPWQYARCPF